jgi:hypothetical protein
MLRCIPLFEDNLHNSLFNNISNLNAYNINGEGPLLWLEDIPLVRFLFDIFIFIFFAFFLSCLVKFYLNKYYKNSSITSQ